LLRFGILSDRPALVAAIEKPFATEVFCLGGDALLTSEGELIDVHTGRVRKTLRFPSA
jgi:hypothetical protein